VLRAAALLHDVTHIPYGHNIEDQTGLLPRHDQPERFAAVLGDTELGAELDRQGLRAEVLAILTGAGRAVPSFWRQVVSDTIDADLLDYLRRDAHFTGLELRYDRRVLDYFRVDRQSQQLFVDCEKNGMLREDIVSELLRVLECRYHFSERVYYHHAKIAAGALLSRMVELAMRSGALAGARAAAAHRRVAGVAARRLDLGEAVATERLRRFVARYQRRALPKRVLVLPYYQNQGVQDELLATYFTPGRPEARFRGRRRWNRPSAQRFGQAIDVILYCPKRRMQLKEAKTLVRFPGSGDRTLPLDAFASADPAPARPRRELPAHVEALRVHVGRGQGRAARAAGDVPRRCRRAAATRSCCERCAVRAAVRPAHARRQSALRVVPGARARRARLAPAAGGDPARLAGAVETARTSSPTRSPRRGSTSRSPGTRSR
jgi:hypothetical protein